VVARRQPFGLRDVLLGVKKPRSCNIVPLRSKTDMYRVQLKRETTTSSVCDAQSDHAKGLSEDWESGWDRRTGCGYATRLPDT
jgi:hypothetical protein